MEVYFPADLDISYEFLQKLLVNGYNLLEPEHSLMFPLIQYDIVFPTVFGCKSSIITCTDYDLMIYNEETEYAKKLI